MKGHTDAVEAVAFSPDGTLLASASNDETVRLWNTGTGQEVRKIEGHSDKVGAVAFSWDGSLLASASEDQTVRLWDAGTGQEVQKIENVPKISTISPSFDSSALITNRGAISIAKGHYASPTLYLSTNTTSLIKNGWIQQNGRNLLWLPQEYRSAKSAFCNGTFAFGLHSGQVNFINLEWS